MPGWELIGDEERKLVNQVIDSKVLFAHGFDKMRQNYFVREYEDAFSDKLSTTKHHALAVSSGSAALKVALQAADIGPGDEVITQCHTFIATVEAILEVGATPVIVDINRTLNMDCHALRAAITPNTKAIIPVHMLGECCHLSQIRIIAGHRWVIEDAAQAMGAMHAGQYAGTVGDMGCFSTDAGKTICTGEGGMILTKHAATFKRARAIHDHGHAYSKDLSRAEDVALCRGFNYRLTELQAAVGLAQLSKFEDILSIQKLNKRLLKEKLPAWEYRFCYDPSGDAGDTLAFYFPDKPSALRYVRELNRLGLGTKNLPDALNWHYAGNWKHLGLGQWPRSMDILERCVAIPISLNMDIERTAALMIEAAN